MADLPAREARERLPAAFAAQGLQFPKGRVLFNLLPAQLPKRGFPLDLALATAILVESGQLTTQLPGSPQALICLGELDLAGKVHCATRGTLLVAAAAKQLSPQAQLLTASQALREAQLVNGLTTVAIDGLHQLGPRAAPTPPPVQVPQLDSAPQAAAKTSQHYSSIRGQELARQAAIYACAGRHSLLLQGPPGTGKSLLARSLAELQPALSHARAIELAQVEALHGPVHTLSTSTPFRAPHHSISAQALLGGGRPLRAGELSRAHGGVLFLDELPEFSRPCLEGLRQPLEEHEVRIERTGESACFPADFMLIAARNPCPCGFATHPTLACNCTHAQLTRYQQRTSGPLLDRFDLFVEMGPVRPDVLSGPATSPSLGEAQQAIRHAHSMQSKRQSKSPQSSISRATRDEIINSGVDEAAQQALQQAADQLQWSGRGIDRCLRLARTIADTQLNPRIQRDHVLAALRFRPPRQSFALSS